MLFVGYSAGGNLLLKAIHAIGTVPRLTAVVTICQGYSIYLGGKHLRAVSPWPPPTRVRAGVAAPRSPLRLPRRAPCPSAASLGQTTAGAFLCGCSACAATVAQSV